VSEDPATHESEADPGVYRPFTKWSTLTRQRAIVMQEPQNGQSESLPGLTDMWAADSMRDVSAWWTSEIVRQRTGDLSLFLITVIREPNRAWARVWQNFGFCCRGGYSHE
jgi:hypothetical protein